MLILFPSESLVPEVLLQVVREPLQPLSGAQPSRELLRPARVVPASAGWVFRVSLLCSRAVSYECDGACVAHPSGTGWCSPVQSKPLLVAPAPGRGSRRAWSG